jgi:hypothetical protein
MMPMWCRVTMIDCHGVAVASSVLAGPAAPGLAAVDDVARLALTARRLGGGVTLSEVSSELRALLELSGFVIGVAGLVVEMEG